MTDDTKHLFIKFIWHLCVFFGEVSIRYFAHFYLGCFLILSFKSSSYVLDNSLSSYESFVNVFSRSVTYLFILLAMSFLEFPGGSVG